MSPDIRFSRARVSFRMPDQKRDRDQIHGTDESVDLQPVQMRIDPQADNNPPDDSTEGNRNSRRLSADLPYGLPTDDLHPTGTPTGQVSSGFSDLPSGVTPHLENENAQKPRGIVSHPSAAGGTRMTDNDRKNPQTQDDGYDRPTGETSRYDAEKEIPDPEQVERDIKEAERKYGNQGGNKVA